MSEFQHSHDRDSDSFVAGLERHGFEQLAGVLALAFGGDGGRSVEH
ncbi:MAG TPA: hypothetical protein VK789_16135 [Bryobacteraceae bacterium]|nr:hypothetical protein [Bryobacteraceae bacterium]